MNLVPHPQTTKARRAIGREQAPLLVIDNLVADAAQLVELAAGKRFGSDDTYYPGIRVKSPLSYQQFVLERLRGEFGEFFDLPAASLRFTSCHFSMPTRPPEQLDHLQCIPHIDSTSGTQLAFVHYLFQGDLGGTAFYRHRHTGFETITPAREAEYFRRVAEERAGPQSPERGYIVASTPLYEQIHAETGVFNRMLVYRRHSLHSGSFVVPQALDSDPRRGRLTLNGFIE